MEEDFRGRGGVPQEGLVRRQAFRKTTLPRDCFSALNLDSASTGNEKRAMFADMIYLP